MIKHPFLLASVWHYEFFVPLMSCFQAVSGCVAVWGQSGDLCLSCLALGCVLRATRIHFVLGCSTAACTKLTDSTCVCLWCFYFVHFCSVWSSFWDSLFPACSGVLVTGSTSFLSVRLPLANLSLWPPGEDPHHTFLSNLALVVASFNFQLLRTWNSPCSIHLLCLELIC